MVSCGGEPPNPPQLEGLRRHGWLGREEPPDCSGAETAGSNAMAPGPEDRRRRGHPFPRGASIDRTRQRHGCDTVLQSEHQMSAIPIVTEHRTRAIPGPPLARTVCAQRILVHRMRKGRAAKDAPRWRKKGDACPASAAQTVGLADDLAAAEAARRQYPIDYCPAHP